MRIDANASPRLSLRLLFSFSYALRDPSYVLRGLCRGHFYKFRTKSETCSPKYMERIYDDFIVLATVRRHDGYVISVGRECRSGVEETGSKEVYITAVIYLLDADL